MLKNFLVGLIYFWHIFLGKILGVALGQPLNCRFYPSCSVYTAQAVEKFGVIKGAKLGFLRIFKCHPFGKFGIDLLE